MTRTYRYGWLAVWLLAALVLCNEKAILSQGLSCWKKEEVNCPASNYSKCADQDCDEDEDWVYYGTDCYGDIFEPVWTYLCPDNTKEDVLNAVQKKETCIATGSTIDHIYESRSAKKQHECWKTRFCDHFCTETTEVTGEEFYKYDDGSDYQLKKKKKYKNICKSTQATGSAGFLLDWYQCNDDTKDCENVMP